MIEFSVPGITPILNKALRTHWAKRRKWCVSLAWRIRVASAGHAPRDPIEFAAVEIERHAVGVAPDVDGLFGSAKPILDCLQPSSERHPYGLGFIADDSPDHIRLAVSFHRVGKRVDQKTVIRIRNLKE